MSLTILQKQSLLAFFGMYSDPKKQVDGIWGPASTEATRKFQKAVGLSPDGSFGPATEKKAREMVGKNQMPSIPKPSKPTPVNPNPQSWSQIKHFKRAEFGCKCGGKYCNGFPVEPNLKLAAILDQIRDHFGKPVTITSGIRCKQHNANVGGVYNSQHVLGNAADIQVQGVSPATVAAYVETLMPNYGGIGRYNSFTHVDVRPNRSRWRG